MCVIALRLTLSRFAACSASTKITLKSNSSILPFAKRTNLKPFGLQPLLMVGNNINHLQWGRFQSFIVHMVPKNQIFSTQQVTVEGINLCEFCKSHNIDRIHTYISDIEGMDYTVLLTMKPYIDERRIQFIQVESECDHWDGQVHEGLPSNKEHLFCELLDQNYTLYKRQQGPMPQIGGSTVISTTNLSEIKNLSCLDTTQQTCHENPLNDDPLQDEKRLQDANRPPGREERPQRLIDAHVQEMGYASGANRC